MAAPLLLRGFPLLRLRFCNQRLQSPSFVLLAPRLFSASSESGQPYDDAASIEDNTTTVLRTKDPPKYPRWPDPDYRKWKERETQILKDIEPVIFLAKEIIHSDRYMDGERLTAEDEKIVVDKLLAYHPHCEDKIGCGLDSIMVDRHPQFRRSRCLFVVRTDGGWIDFSYQKCLRQYIRDKYPSYAEKFIKEHFKRGS
ncbi:protein DCL homolog, chloroplastic [Nicotiana tabacum]|uniref:Protein DCL homolog, chloroplastic n=3 Tax=Nicotiana TaxID=4085 RepID=A0AC58SUS6_TOBAC|nr:PREDICTED: protein DCL, chloroplastic [Nicotiana sylvestris]